MSFDRSDEDFRFTGAGTYESISYTDAVELMQNSAQMAADWQQQPDGNFIFIEHAQKPTCDAERRSRSRSSSRGRYTKRKRSEDRDDDRNRPRSRRRSRSRSRSRSRGYSSGGNRRASRSRSHSRSRSRSPGRRYSRSRSRSYDRDREYNDEYYADSGYRYRGRREDVPPNSTVILKGLPLFCDEALIWDVMGQQCFTPKDIRVVRRRDTGGNRGFAFVEFSDVNEAMRWMVYTQGRVQLDERTVVDVEYSFTKASSGPSPALQAASGAHSSGIGDWTCARCYTHNFKKRDTCFKCNIRRDESEALVSDGFNEIGVMPCDTLLLRNLPITADEQRVLVCVNKLSSLEVRRIMVARHAETRQSRCFAYLEMHGITEAAQLLTTITAVTKLNVDGREIFVSYSKYPFEAVISGANLAEDSCSQLPVGTSSRYTARPSTSSNVMQTDVTNAAAAVAQSAIQKAHVMRQVAASYLPGGSLSSPPSSSSVAGRGDPTVTAALLAQQQRTTAAAGGRQPSDGAPSSACAPVSLGVVQTPHGELPRYPIPDVSTFQYERSSGYYYDSTTGLYYDVKSQYYYNAETQQYLYWDSSYQTYLPAPASQPAAANDGQKSATSATTKSQPAETNNEPHKKPSDKKEKVKIAKKIQKDMEKWAKQCDKSSQKKEVKGVVSAVEPQDIKPSGAADAAFSVLEKTTRGLTTNLVSYEAGDSDEESANNSAKVVQMPGANASSAEDVDYEKMACLLCRRQFPSREVLLKHQQFSDLHKQNLEAKQKSNLSVTEQMLMVISDKSGGQYRDRAKERRQKFGDDDRPMKNRLKEKYLESLGTGAPEQPTSTGIKSDNIGNKLLKNMGWQEGQGLGRANQGIVDPVTQKRLSQGVGLGSTPATETDESATYKEQVMAVMRQKYYGDSGPGT